MATLARGEIWWYEEPDRKPRPHLILARDEVIPLLHQILSVPTTTVGRGIHTEVSLDRSDGMPSECVLTLDNTWLIRKSFCTQLITRLSVAKMFEVCEALRRATGC